MKKLGILVFILFTINLSAQTTSEKIDQLITKYQEFRLFNGSALVADNNFPALDWFQGVEIGRASCRERV